MTTVSLRFDDEMKKQLDEMCDEMGMNLTTFFMIYAKNGLLIPQITKIFILYPGKALLYLKNFEDIFPKQVYKGTDDIYHLCRRCMGGIPLLAVTG